MLLGLGHTHLKPHPLTHSFTRTNWIVTTLAQVETPAE